MGDSYFRGSLRKSLRDLMMEMDRIDRFEVMPPSALQIFGEVDLLRPMGSASLLSSRADLTYRDG